MPYSTKDMYLPWNIQDKCLIPFWRGRSYSAASFWNTLQFWQSVPDIFATWKMCQLGPDNLYQIKKRIRIPGRSFHETSISAFCQAFVCMELNGARDRRNLWHLWRDKMPSMKDAWHRKFIPSWQDSPQTLRQFSLFFDTRAPETMVTSQWKTDKASSLGARRSAWTTSRLP